MAGFIDCNDYAQTPYPEYCIQTFLTSLDNRTGIAQNWRNLEKYYHSLETKDDEESETIKRHIKEIASKIVKFYKNPKAKRPRGFGFEHRMINVTRNEIPLRKQYSAQSLPPPPAAEIKHSAERVPSHTAVTKHKRRVQASQSPPASSSKKRTFSIANPDAVSSMSSNTPLHYGVVTPKDRIGMLFHRGKKLFRLMSGPQGGKSNKRWRGRKHGPVSTKNINNIVLLTNRLVKRDYDNYLRNNDSGNADGGDDGFGRFDRFDCFAENVCQSVCPTCCDYILLKENNICKKFDKQYKTPYCLCSCNIESFDVCFCMTSFCMISWPHGPQ